MISLISSPLTVLFSVSLVNMLSIKVAQWDVSLLGPNIFWIKTVHKFISHCFVLFFCLFGFNRSILKSPKMKSTL